MLVSGTDGVGTKLKVAQLAGIHNTVGIDLVAMCVNDCLCCGAEPLFFLDYVAMSHDDPGLLEAIVTGISDGCLASDMALIGGETAIMPDFYQRGRLRPGRLLRWRGRAGEGARWIDDLGGRCGAWRGVEWTAFQWVQPGAEDRVRDGGLEGRRFLRSRVVGRSATVLLRPTTIYSRAVRGVLSHYKVKSVVHGIAHITGGGLHENLARVSADGDWRDD